MIRLWLLVISIIFSGTAFSQITTNYEVSLSGIDAVKIDMSKTALEKLLNTKITIRDPDEEINYLIDTAK